jgi:DNA-binding LacI/PurR family transcriptional regulator
MWKPFQLCTLARMSPRPTLDQVAARAGVSRTAASRVVNNAPNVSRAKRDAVERAVKDLGYQPNRTARALATSRTDTIVLAISGDGPDILSDPFYGAVLVGVSDALEDTDLHLILCLVMSGRGQTRLRHLIDRRGVDGIMLMSLRGDDPAARIAAGSGLPTVFGGRPEHGRPRWFVDADNIGGARLAVEHLIASGRRRILMINGVAGAEVSDARRRGGLEALTLAGLQPYATYDGDFTDSSGAAAVTATAPGFDAVFAANDNMAAGAVRALQAAGRSVPDDVAVVGFDDMAIAGRTDPPLTTVRQPVRALGREMTRMLVAAIAGDDPHPLILPTALIRRASA